ncbi:hypothetical protein Tco_1234386, partial [Tanacetum coccineum]
MDNELVNEARGAKDTLTILFWGAMHKRFGVITSWDICYDLKSCYFNVEQFKLFNDPGHIILLRPNLEVLQIGIKAKVIENQVKCLYLDYNRFQTLHHKKGFLWDIHSSSLVALVRYSHVIGFSVIQGYIYVYIIAWRPASLGYGLLQTLRSRLPEAAPASRTTLSPGYVADSDPKEDSKDGPVDYPANGGGGNNDDSSDDDKEEEEALEEEEEEHLALADSVVAPVVDHVPSSKEIKPFETNESAATPPSPPAYRTTTRISRTTARISIRPEAPMPFPSEEERNALLGDLAAPALPIFTSIVPHPYGSPNHVRAPLGFRAAMGRLRASSPSTHHPLHPSPPLPPLPSSLHLHHMYTQHYIYLPITILPLPPNLPASLLIPPPVDYREDTPEAAVPPRKRLCLTLHLTSRYEVGESSTAAPRPTRGHGIDYRFIDTLDAETRHQKAEKVSYGIRDVWVDPTEAVEEDRQTQLFQRVDGLVEDRHFHYETVRLLDQEALALQARGQTHADDHEGAASTAVGLVFSFLVLDNHLIEARVSAALSNHETLRNSTNSQGDRSHNSNTGIKGTVRTPRKYTYKDILNCKPLSFKGTEGVVVLSQWFEKMESVFHISNCTVENQVKFATCTFLGNDLTWWNSHIKTVTQDVAYAMDWKALKKMMTVKYCLRDEMKK